VWQISKYDYKSNHCDCHSFYRLVYVCDRNFKSQTLRKSGARRQISTMDLCFLLDSIPVHHK
jgi:hypothetical protein